MTWPGFASVGPVLTTPRSGLPPVGCGTWICIWPSDGVPLSESELPVNWCAPALIRVRNSTNPFVSVSVTMNVYVHTSPDELVSVGGDTMITLAEGVKLYKFSKPGMIEFPVVLVWSKLTVMVWLVPGPVMYTRTGIKSSSCQFVTLPEDQLVLPNDWPCNWALNDPSENCAWAYNPDDWPVEVSRRVVPMRSSVNTYQVV